MRVTKTFVYFGYVCVRRCVRAARPMKDETDNEVDRHRRNPPRKEKETLSIGEGYFAKWHHGACEIHSIARKL